MSKKAMVNQLISIRSQVDVMLEMLTQEEVPECQHENRLDLSTFGKKKYRCKDCGEEWTEE